jgi:hypothetical protein
MQLFLKEKKNEIQLKLENDFEKYCHAKTVAFTIKP